MNRPGKVTSSSVFVVSGGAKGITAQCVIRLAQQYRCKFILLGRSASSAPESAWVSPDADDADMKKQLFAHLSAQGEKPTPARIQQLVGAISAAREIESTLQAVQQAGGQAEYHSVDITNLQSVQAVLPAAIQRMGGTVTALLHGAGSLADKLIEKKTLRDFESVYNVKIRGLENLLACISLPNLDYLLLFASVAGFYGNVGQADYALANEILNKTAHLVRRAHPACHVVAINWGPWDGGMVTPALRQYFEQHHIALIAVDDGVQMLINELEQPHSASAQVVIGSPINTARSQPGTALRTLHIRRRLTLAANPFLHDHIIGGRPVLPAVFGVAWLTNACEQLYPGYTFSSIKHFKVLKGIVFDETLADAYTLDLKEIAKNDAEIVFEGTVWSETDTQRKRFHYTGQVTLRRELPPAPTYATFDRSENYTYHGEKLYQDGTLFHGPSFQGVERTLNISKSKVTVQCFAPDVSEETQGQFPLQTFNPYLTDIEFQCMLVWVRYFHQAGGMPLGTGLFEYFRGIRPGERFFVSMDTEESTDSKLIATVTVHDADGLVYTRVFGTQVTISERLNLLFAQSRVGMAEQRS